MNFFPATLVREGDKVFVDAKSFKVEIPSSRAAIFYPHTGQSVIFGIRPEDIHNPDFAPPGIDAQQIDANVDVTELMGNEIFVYLANGEHSFVARVDPRTRWHMGDKTPVLFNMDNIHIFANDEEGKAIR
jgi:multiple sugar transport system ATP-binding protein